MGLGAIPLAAANACHLVIGAGFGSCALAKTFVSECAHTAHKEERNTHGLLAGESGLDGRQVCDHVVVDDPSPLRPEVVDEELDPIAGMFEKSPFLVGPAETASDFEMLQGGERTHWYVSRSIGLGSKTARRPRSISIGISLLTVMALLQLSTCVRAWVRKGVHHQLLLLLLHEVDGDG